MFSVFFAAFSASWRLGVFFPMKNEKWKMKIGKWFWLAAFDLHGSLPRRRSRAFLNLLAELHYPQPGVDIVEVDQPIVRLRAPSQWQIRSKALRIARPNSSKLTTLPVEITSKFA